MNTTTDTFTNYLRCQRQRHDPVGDFAREWFTDGSDFIKPRGRFSWRAVRAYLERNNACEPAINAARKAWTEWLNTPPDDAIYELPKLLIRHGIIDENAISDAENFDLGFTANAIQAVIEDLARMLTPPID